MNKFLTLSVFSLFMLGSQSSAMETEKVKKLGQLLLGAKNHLKSEIVKKARDSESLSKLLGNPFIKLFDEDDHADVLSETAYDIMDKQNVYSEIIETLVNKHGFNVNGFDGRGRTPLRVASILYVVGLMNNTTGIITLLELGSNPHTMDCSIVSSCNNIYGTLNVLVSDTQTLPIIMLNDVDDCKMCQGFSKKRAKELLGLFDKYFPNKP